MLRRRKGEACKMDTEYKSRTRKKNEDRALQRLGEQLVSLPFGQLETMELPDELLTAIEFARKIRSHGARRTPETRNFNLAPLAWMRLYRWHRPYG